MPSRRSSRQLLAASALVVPLALFVALAVAARSSPTSAGGHNEAANKRAASRDSQALLDRLLLPAGAKDSRQEPPGGGSALADPIPVISSPDVIDHHAWWVVPGPVRAALAFVRAHPPAGSRLESSGSGGQYGLTTAWSLRFSRPPVASVLYARALSVVLARLPDGSTGVVADAGDMWDIPRAAGERIPSTASVLDVVVTHPHARPSPSIAVTHTVTVAKIAALIDRLETVQPIAISCPMILSQRAFVTFTFRAATRGPVLAQAREPAGTTGSVPECEPMQLTISGRAYTPLLGGPSAIRQAEALLGVSLR
jgi:hypothetical protein